MLFRPYSLKAQFSCSWHEAEYEDIVGELKSMPPSELVEAKKALDLAIGKRFFYSKACNTGKMTVAIVIQVILMFVFLSQTFESLQLLLPLYVYVLALSTLQLHRYTSKEFVHVKWPWCRVPLAPSVLTFFVGTPSIVLYAIWTTEDAGYVGAVAFICLVAIAGMFVCTAFVELFLYQFYVELRENYQSMWDEIVVDYPEIVDVLPADYEETTYIRL